MLRRPHSLLVRGSKAYFGIGGFPITPNLTIGGCGRSHAGRAGDLSRTTRRRRCETDRFEQYEYALKELLKKKPFGQKIEAPRDREPSKAVNLMDALRRSVETERAGGEQRKPAARDALAGRPAQRQKRQAECITTRRRSSCSFPTL